MPSDLDCTDRVPRARLSHGYPDVSVCLSQMWCDPFNTGASRVAGWGEAMNLKDVAEQAFDQSIRTILEDIVTEHVRMMGVATTAERAVQDKAAKMLDQDEELRAMLKDALIEAIESARATWRSQGFK